MPRRFKPDPLPRCVAIRWASGDQCEQDAAFGQVYCAAHAALLPQDDWAASGYASKLPESLQPLLPAAAFIGLSEEIRLARVSLLDRLDHGATGAEVVGMASSIARLIRFQRELEADVLKEHRSYEHRREIHESSSRR